MGTEPAYDGIQAIQRIQYTTPSLSPRHCYEGWHGEVINKTISKVKTAFSGETLTFPAFQKCNFYPSDLSNIALGD